MILNQKGLKFLKTFFIFSKAFLKVDYAFS